MRASALVVILVLLVRSLAAAEPGAAGQGVVQGAVQGVVRDDTGAALPGVTVYLRSGDQTRMAVTGAGARRHSRERPGGAPALELHLGHQALARQRRLGVGRPAFAGSCPGQKSASQMTSRAFDNA